MPISIWTKKQKEEREEKEGGERSKRERGRKSWKNGGISLAGDRLDHLWEAGHPTHPSNSLFTGQPLRLGSPCSSHWLPSLPSFFCLFSPWFFQWAAEGSPSNPSNFPLPAFLPNVITAQRIPSIHCPGCHKHMALHNLNSTPFQPQEKYGLGMSMFLLNG